MLLSVTASCIPVQKKKQRLPSAYNERKLSSTTIEIVKKITQNIKLNKTVQSDSNSQRPRKKMGMLSLRENVTQWLLSQKFMYFFAAFRSCDTFKVNIKNYKDFCVSTEYVL